MRMVHPDGLGRQHFRSDREGGCSSRQLFAVGLVCWNSLPVWRPYLECRLYFGPGAHLSAPGLATPSTTVCRGWSDGIDRLLDAIRAVHFVLLSLHHRSLWTHRSSDRAGSHLHSVWGTSSVQQLVVKALSF